jgi:hypothetical protein
MWSHVMQMGLAEHARTLPGTCAQPERADPRQEAVPPARRAEGLLVALAEGAEPAVVRGQAWLAAEALRAAEANGEIDRRLALWAFDLLGALWTTCDRLDRGWRHLDRGQPSTAMQAASGTTGPIEEIEALSRTDAGPAAQLRARAQALWHLADGLDEAGFLVDCGDHRGARDRARRLLLQVEQLSGRGVLTLDEQDIAASAASRWGARPRNHQGGSLAS